MAWTSSAGPRESFASWADWLGSKAGSWLASRDRARSWPHYPLRALVAAHLGAVLFVLQSMPESVVTVLLSATGLLLGLAFTHAMRASWTCQSNPADAPPIEEHPGRIGLSDLHSRLREPGRTEGVAPRLAVRDDLSRAREAQSIAQAARDVAHERPLPPGSDPALSALMAQISHEIRTPLNAVIGFSDLMQAELFGPLGHARYAEYVDHIRDSGRALLKSAEDTLAMTALLAGGPHTTLATGVSLVAAASDAWTCIEPDARRRGLALQLDIARDIDVLIDRRALRQILLNLLSEAVGRAQAGATIILRATTDKELAQIEIVASRVTTESRCSRETLGLSIAGALIGLSGSDLIEIDSRDDSWTVVTVLERVVQADFFAGCSAAEDDHRVCA